MSASYPDEVQQNQFSSKVGHYLSGCWRHGRNVVDGVRIIGPQRYEVMRLPIQQTTLR
jgi:hypothetical protein